MVNGPFQFSYDDFLQESTLSSELLLPSLKFVHVSFIYHYDVMGGKGRQ